MWHKLSADNLDPDFVERRRVGLENFLLRVASHPVLSDDKIFFLFLTEVSTYSTKWPNPFCRFLPDLSVVLGICFEQHCPPHTGFSVKCGRIIK